MHHSEDSREGNGPFWQEEKSTYVRRMFNGISRHYDFLNHFLSAGVDRHWRKRAIRISHLGTDELFLDVACGTGDLSIEALKVDRIKVVAVDFAENMLQGFTVKKTKMSLDGKVELVQADAEKLPFPDETFDVTAVAFGARNFGDLRAGLTEMHRVIKRNGRIVVLEFSKPRHFLLRQIYFFYFNKVLPAIGRLISGDPTAYSYLPSSVLTFPDGDEFMEVMQSVDFREIKSFALTFGIATAYFGVK